MTNTVRRIDKSNGAWKIHVGLAQPIVLQASTARALGIAEGNEATIIKHENTVVVTLSVPMKALCVICLNPNGGIKVLDGNGNPFEPPVLSPSLA